MTHINFSTCKDHLLHMSDDVIVISFVVEGMSGYDS